MATIQFEISNYLVYRNSANNGDVAAVIHCYNSSGVIKATLYFYAEGATIPANTKVSSDSFYLRYRLSAFDDVVDLLRNEKPVSAWLVDTSLHGGITTSKEPIGEGE